MRKRGVVVGSRCVGIGKSDVSIDGDVKGVGGVRLPDLGDLRRLYGELDSGLLGGIGGSGETDERAELMLLRGFAVRLFRGLGGGFERAAFVGYLRRECGYSEGEAVKVWDGFSSSLPLLRGFIEYNYSDTSVITVLLRVFSEIRGLTKQIVDKDLRMRKMVSHSSVAELLVDVQREVENRLNCVGGGESAIKGWRLWYKEYCQIFMAKHIKQG